MEPPNHDFVARGELTLPNKRFPVIVRGVYPELGTEPMNCRIIPENSDQIWGTHELDWAFMAKFRGKTEGHKTVAIAGLSHLSIIGWGPSNYMEGDALEFMIGDLDELDATKGNTQIFIYLPPTPLANPGTTFVQSYDGTIKIHGDDTSEGITWQTQQGPAQLSYSYMYQGDQYGLDEATVRIRKCRIRLHADPAHIRSLDQLLSAIDTATNDALKLLSFLSRKRLNWYAIEANFYSTPSSPANDATALMGRQAWLGFTNKVDSWHDLPVVAASLRLGLFEQLLISYSRSTYKAVIDRAMQFVISTYEAGYLEARLGIAYGGMESLVFGLSAGDKGLATILSRSKFDRLATKIRLVIDEDGQVGEQSETIKKKIPELNRYAFADKLMQMLRHWQVPVDKLWPAGAELQSELQAMISRRNVLIHQGTTDHSVQQGNDLPRLQGIVELWILRILGCPDDAINWLGLTRHIQM